MKEISRKVYFPTGFIVQIKDNNKWVEIAGIADSIETIKLNNGDPKYWEADKYGYKVAERRNERRRLQNNQETFRRSNDGY